MVRMLIAIGLGGGLLLGSVLSANAFSPPRLAFGDASQFQLAQARGPQYDRRRHGPRYRTERSGYSHERDGYFYHEKWWEVDAAPVGARQRSNAHIAWCTERYRSYDAASDSYLSFEGVRRRCNSPY